MQIKYTRGPLDERYWTVYDNTGVDIAGIQGNPRTGYLVAYGEGSTEERIFESLRDAKEFALSLTEPPR